MFTIAAETKRPTVRPMATWTSCSATRNPEEYESEEPAVDSEAKRRSPPFDRPEGSWKRMPTTCNRKRSEERVGVQHQRIRGGRSIFGRKGRQDVRETNHNDESRSSGKLGVDPTQDADDERTEGRGDVRSVDEDSSGEVVCSES
jgi:hypothetical protein